MFWLSRLASNREPAGWRELMDTAVVRNHQSAFFPTAGMIQNAHCSAREARTPIRRGKTRSSLPFTAGEISEPRIAKRPGRSDWMPQDLSKNE